MGLYPIEVPAQELYSADTVRRHKLGTRAIFNTDNGPVEAVYVKNANSATLTAGLCVHQSATAWAVNTNLFGATNCTPVIGAFVGVMCASIPGSATESYAWAACRGPITSIDVAATAASSDHNGVLYGIRAGSADMSSQAATQVITVASNNFNRQLILGIGGGATSTIATSGGAGPAFVNLFWR